MKKNLPALLLTFVILFCATTPVIAMEENVTVVIEGQQVTFSDQQPITVQGRTLVPVRDVFEALGFDVSWESDTQTAILVRGSYEVRISVGSDTFTTNGDEFSIDVNAQIIGSRIMLSIRRPLESVGYYVDWCNTTQTVFVSSTSFGDRFLGVDSLQDAIVILHINDSHGRILSGRGQFGLYQLAGLRAHFEAAGATVLLFDAGDTFHGLPAATLRQGLDIAEIMAAMGFDAMVTGNHDFNYGYRRLIELAEYVDFPILAANVLFEESGMSAFDGHTIIERNGTMFGIFGIATPVTPQRTHPRNTVGLVFTCPIEAAEEQVALLTEAGADFIIALTHVGVDPIDGITADEIAAEVDGIDIILDGHSHVAIAGSVPVRDDISLIPHGGTVIASTSGHMREIGVILIQDGEITSLLLDADTEIPTDEAIYALVYALIAAQDEILSEVIGNTPVYLDGARENVRTRQTNLGNLAANAMLEASGANVAFINGGGVRDSIAIGNITRNDLIRVFPFGNYVVTLEVPGSAILYALEHGLSAYPAEMGSFLQVAGIEFTFDPNMPAYERITSAYVNGEPLVPNGLYILATNDYLAAGNRLNSFPVVGNFNALEEILIEYFQDSMPDAVQYVTPFSERAFEHFITLTEIPRGSSHEQQVSDFLINFAEELGFEAIQDEALNVLIRKPGTVGRENEPAIILQAHMDIVWEKNAGVVHNWYTDPLPIIIDGNWITADGTTLGADNGGGLAIIMALLEATDISHPPIEALITTEEEIGLLGAQAFDVSLLTGTRMINVDGSDEREFIVSSAGAATAFITLPLSYDAVSDGLEAYRIAISGLVGGHSGFDIHLGRGNANILLAQLLQNLVDTYDVRIYHMSGGNARNSIPREASATVLIAPAMVDAVRAAIDAAWSEVRATHPNDPNMEISITAAQSPQRVITADSTRTLLDTILDLPSGVIAMFQYIEGLVMTSNNLGVVEIEGDNAVLTSMFRTSDLSDEDDLINLFDELIGDSGQMDVLRSSRPWEFVEDSPLRDAMTEVYIQLFGRQPDVVAVHAGLEPSIFASSIPGSDMISIGPDIFDLHTPDERMYIPSFHRMANFMVLVLEAI